MDCLGRAHVIKGVLINEKGRDAGMSESERFEDTMLLALKIRMCL